MSGTSRVSSLADAVRRHVQSGQHLHFASTPSRSNAAILEVARAFRKLDPRFTLSSTGFHSLAHLLGLLRLGRRYLACFFGDHHPSPRPNKLWTRVAREGAIVERWPVLAYSAAFRAGALGDTYGIARGLSRSALGLELARLGRYFEVPDPVEPSIPLGVVTAIRPDITFIHAARSDEDGCVLTSAPLSEGYWSALGARNGVIVTVEEIVDRSVTREHPEAIRIPPSRVLAVCKAPFGAHPQSLFTTPNLAAPAYPEDLRDLERWRAIAERDDLDAIRFLLEAEDRDVAYREFVGASRCEQLAAHPRPSSSNGTPRPPPAASNAPLDENGRLALLAARRIAAIVEKHSYRTVLAGVGVSFLAARLAKLLLADRGVECEIAVETGIIDVECGPGAHPYLLAFDNMALARRLGSIEDTLGALACGAGNRCLAVVGAAQVDRKGDVNSSELADGRLLVGPGGAADLAACADEMLVLVRADPARMVGRVDHVTSPGHSVREVVTDRGVLQKTGPTWRAINLTADADESVIEAASALRRACPWPLEIDHALAPAFTVTERARIHALTARKEIS